jgi:hypothetical protein
MTITSLRTATSVREEVIYIVTESAVALVLGVAMLVVALITLMVKLIELGRK